MNILQQWLPGDVKRIAEDAQAFDPDNKSVSLTDGQRLKRSFMSN